MRATLSLDDDVADLLKKEIRHSGVSFKEAVNQLLRLGLAMRNQKNTKRFVVTPRAMGLSTGLSYDNVSELLETLEGSAHN